MSDRPLRGVIAAAATPITAGFEPDLDRFVRGQGEDLVQHWRFATQVEARLAVFEFIEGWYHPHRRHSALDYESPIRYEKKHRPAA